MPAREGEADRSPEAGNDGPLAASRARRRLALGIDPGTAVMGYGLVAYEEDQLEPIEFGVITTPQGLSLANRLQILYRELSAIIDRTRPTETAIEELFFSRNVQSALAVGQARGVAILAAANHGLPVNEYTPLQVKQSIVGYGRARKEQIQEMVRVLLDLPDIPQPDDAADALALAICHLHSSRWAGLLEENNS